VTSDLAGLTDQPPDAPHSAHRTSSGARKSWTNSKPRAIEIVPVSIT
jgi:hypothetical protein